MRLHVPIAAIAAAALALCLSSTALQWHDDFSAYAEEGGATPNWAEDGIGWIIRGGTYRGEWTGISALSGRPRKLYATIAAEASVRPERAVGEGWKLTGVMLRKDERNFWHLALVEGPDSDGKEHFVELCEMRDGKWLSQQNLKKTAEENTKHAWAYGAGYLLRIELSPDGIVGTVRDASGGELARIGYAFTDAAVTRGWPALRVSAMSAAFDDFRVDGEDAGAQAVPQPAERRFPAYGVPGSGVEAVMAPPGFFRVEKDGERWWLVDPRGERFYAVGTDHVNYNTHYCQELGYAPYSRNCEKKYGSIQAWSDATASRLRQWGFNLLGANNVPEVRYKGLAHTLFAAFGSTFSGYSALVEKVHWTGFPNVFHPRWEAYCQVRARQACAPNRNDPWLLGYFLDNELEWYGKSHRETGIFEDTLKWPPDHSGKQALVAFLKGRHGTIDAFNRVWGQQLSAWNEVGELTELKPPGPEAVEAQRAFLRVVAARYFGTAAAAVRAADPSHLVIGSRFAGNAPDWAWEACAEVCDVVTFNHYPRIDFETGDLTHLAETFGGYYAKVGKPMMITEWSFPALDSGLPCKHGAGMRVDTQAQKARCFEAMQHLLFRLPFMVGSDYFMWADEPELGISDTFPEDSNYGLVNVDDVPYKELTDACRRLNPRAFRLHAGLVPEVYVRRLEASPQGVEVAVENLSTETVAVVVRAQTGGREEEAGVRVAPGHATAKLPLRLPAGVHAVRAEIVRGPDWPHGCRGVHRLDQSVRVPGLAWPRAARDGRRLPLLVVNPTSESLLKMPLLLTGVAFGPGDRAPAGSWLDVSGSGTRLPVQLLGQGGAVLIAPGLPPGDSLSGYLYTGQPAEASRIDVNMLRTDAGGYVVDNGVLRLEHDGTSGHVVDRVSVAGVQLGAYNPLVWQFPGQNQWTPADSLGAVRIRRGRVACVLEVIAAGGPQGQAIGEVDEQGRQEETRRRSTAFRVAHRVVVWPGCPYVAAQLLWVENADVRQELRLKGCFFYLRSFIGGSVDGDVPGSGADVPNYYRRVKQSQWHDAGAGARYGCVPQDESITAHFWLDGGGGQHPDARIELSPDVVLAPGERYTPETRPVLFVFGALDASDSPAAWPRVRQVLAAQRKLRIELMAAESR